MAQADILTVTLNPAVDVATTVPQVIAGPKLRCGPPRFDPGGGGVNVARAVCKLGGAATALVAVGGAMGDRLLALLAGEAVPALPVAVSGETRQSFAVTDASTGGQFRFSVPGDVMTTPDADALLSAIVAQAPPDGYLVISGSVAPGLPDDFLGQIVAAISAKVIVDTSGKPLDLLIRQPQTPLHLLRIDQAEAEQAAGHAMPALSDSVDYAAELVARGVADHVITGHGADGSVMVSNHDRFICHPPSVQERSKIGAGDAFVGAATLALARRSSPSEALQRGVAAASATVETEGTALCQQSDAEVRFGECKVERI
ncbi:6-phosphofructokinase [Yoonia maricola]|uniref:Phosphofructokinase n=1 Tax=Yoonia maricola TaxID=420999 RepID=A0A2M8WMB1_9RHOB|nr:1-phosphofructokinase family hexose kinase [Yoonia maricola]PJI92071.1 6-phosphofructokinase [Yoonia maricola]